MAVQAAAITKLISAATGRPQAQAGSAQEVMGTFSEALERAMSGIGESQTRADDLIQGLQTGKVKDVHEVMSAVEEAGLTMQLALQLRSKAIEAYQEIMRMQV